MDKQHKPSAKTIRLDERDWNAIAAIREYYGITSDNDAIRLALRETQRRLDSDTIPSPPKPPNKERLIPPSP